MVKERPILFSGAMVRAILDGTKTQTRRIVKVRGLEFIGGKGQENDPSAWGYPYPDREGYADLTDGIPCPYGKPGDCLYVRETWSDRGDMRPFYRADQEPYLPYGGRWKPSIHMPRWASRITLEVESVRVERLNDCSMDDALAEGVSDRDPETGAWQNPKEEYADLWESINGPGSWDANPLVWVVTFKRINP
jgi:hypothetical protein